MLWSNLAQEEARTAYKAAFELDRTFTPAAAILAELIRSDEKEAESVLRKALAKSPGAGEIQHALGLSLVRQKRTPEAMEWS